jgi:TetR/AcrR family transcriptional repressor for divergent bdcA
MDKAVTAAMKLFHARGYDAVGVAELGAALGITPPSLYAAFGSKAGLFARVLEAYSRSDANIFASARADGGTVVEVIDRMLAYAARLYATHDGIAGCLVHDSARNSADPEARTLSAAARRDARAALRAFIATDYPAQADALADLVVIATAGMSSAARDGASAATLERFAASISRAFRREAGRG